MKDLETLTVLELKDLEDKIARAKIVAKDKLREEIREYAKERGFTIEELFVKKRGRPTERGKRLQNGQNWGASEIEKTITESMPKYRDPNNPKNIWSGFGPPPRWMKEKLKLGAKKEDFLIQ